jgi:alpha-L-fucosidase
MNINTETSSILPETPFGNDANAAHIYKALETWNQEVDKIESNEGMHTPKHQFILAVADYASFNNAMFDKQRLAESIPMGTPVASLNVKSLMEITGTEAKLSAIKERMTDRKILNPVYLETLDKLEDLIFQIQLDNNNKGIHGKNFAAKINEAIRSSTTYFIESKK